MPRAGLFLSVLLCALISGRAQSYADTVALLIQGHWIQSLLENGEAKPIGHDWGAGMYSIQIDAHTYTSITNDPCSGMVSKGSGSWKYNEADNTFEILWEEEGFSWYYELLQLDETTLHLRRTGLPEGSAPDVYGLVYRRSQKEQ